MCVSNCFKVLSIFCVFTISMTNVYCAYSLTNIGNVKPTSIFLDENYHLCTENITDKIICVLEYKSGISLAPMPLGCNPSSCGPGAICRRNKGGRFCECESGLFGNPYEGCGVECVLDSDCSLKQACIRSECRDPCVGMLCGIGADCNIVNHAPVCSCPFGKRVDPFINCDVLVTPPTPLGCNPSLCGPGAICRRNKEGLFCECESGLFGNPYEGCREECALDSDCSLKQACIRSQCRDPCVGVCGIGADCNIVNHAPMCSCPSGTRGDPFKKCDVFVTRRNKLAEFNRTGCSKTSLGGNDVDIILIRCLNEIYNVYIKGLHPTIVSKRLGTKNETSYLTVTVISNPFYLRWIIDDKSWLANENKNGIKALQQVVVDTFAYDVTLLFSWTDNNYFNSKYVLMLNFPETSVNYSFIIEEGQVIEYHTNVSENMIQTRIQEKNEPIIQNSEFQLFSFGIGICAGTLLGMLLCVLLILLLRATVCPPLKQPRPRLSTPPPEPVYYSQVYSWRK